MHCIHDAPIPAQKQEERGARGREGAPASGPGGSALPEFRAVVRSSARSYRSARGRTQQRAVVPSRARSYLRGLLRYDRADSRTTSRRRVRPREPGYDHASPGTTTRARVRPRGPGYDHAHSGSDHARLSRQHSAGRPDPALSSRRSAPEDAQGLRISPSSLTRAMAIPWRGAVRSNRLTKSPARGQLTEMYMYCGANP